MSDTCPLHTPQPTPGINGSQFSPGSVPNFGNPMTRINFQLRIRKYPAAQLRPQPDPSTDPESAPLPHFRAFDAG